MSEGKKYGLIIPSRVAKNKAVVNPVSVFGNDDDDDDDDQEVNTAGARFPMKDAKKAEIKRQVQLQMEKALAVDPTVYEYDNVYDDLQAKKAVGDKRLASDVERKSKYIGNLLKAAEQRKRDLERRIEKTVQKEREAEKGLYDDKEAFVTDAYRRKMEQIRQEEERERKQEELEAQMDVTKQEDMSAFYRNLLDQTTTDITVKTEPAVNENTASPNEWRSKKPAAVAVPDDEDEDSDDSSSSSSSSTSRKCYTQESMKNRNMGRKDVHHRHDSASDHSSSESGERNRRRAKYDGHHRTKHGRGEKHAAKAATSEEKRSETYTRKGSSDSRKGHSDQRQKAESEFHDIQTDKTSGADSKRRNESNGRGTENRVKRKHTDSAEESTSGRDPKLRNPALCANSDNASSKQTHARTEAEHTAVQSKTARQTVGAALEDAHPRYLARKGKSSVPVVCEDSD